MKKTWLKSFIYSFVVSLSVLFTVDGAYLRNSLKKEEALKISNKNITLFLKKEARAAVAKVEPVKKIALSLPLTPKKEEKAEAIPLDFSINDEVQVASVEAPEEKQEIYSPLAEEADTSLQVAAAEVEPEMVSGSLEKPEAEAAVIPLENTFATQEVKPSVSEIKVVRNDLKEEENSSIPIEKSSVKTEEKIAIVTDKEPAKIAAAGNDLSIREMQSLAESQAEPSPENAQEEKWETMAEKKTKNADLESPWVVAKGAKHPKNNIILDKDYYKDMSSEKISAILNKKEAAGSPSEIKLASEITQNILIPIPEDILKEENVTPQLISSKKEGEEPDAAKELEAGIETNDEDKKSILKSLTSIFSGSNASIKQVGAAKQPLKEGENFFDQITKKVKNSKAPVKILPTEMRLSFQPNRAEISGQTLKWLHAFAKKTVEEDDVVLEVRIDGTASSALQEKRLNLLQNILRNKGVDPYKVNVVFTAREPNSFIIRTIRTNKDADTNKKASNSPSYYQQW